ncbi:MAG: hypothetical protein KDE47_08995, partial [Caldilineaceae bacterium]|nr:hypothetical protein [Caldilineaceae bacterium]
QRVRAGWRWLQRTLWMAATAALLIQLAGRRWPLAQLTQWTLFPFALWLLVIFFYTLLRRRTAMQTARQVDAELGLKEQLATALELTQAAPNASDDVSAILVEKQRAHASRVAQQITNAQLPLPFLRKPLLAAGVCLLAITALRLLPNPMDQVLAERAAIAQAAQEQAARMETLRQEVANSTQLPPAAKEELLRQLEELAQQLRANQGDREDALAEFSKLAEALRQKVDPAAAGRQQALDALAAQLQALAQNQPNSTPPQDAEEALQQLAASLAELTPAGQTELAQALAQLANEAGQSGQRDLAQTLSALAQAVQQGDAATAASAAQSAATQLAQSQAALSTQAALQQTLDQVQSARQALAQSGQAPQSGKAAGQSGQGQQGQQTGQQGQGQQGQGQANGQQGQGQASGQQGQNRGQGAGQGGGGSQASSAPPSTGSGRPNRLPGATDAMSSNAEDQLYVPWERQPTNGAELFIPGQDTGQGQSQVNTQKDPLPGAAAPGRIPYQQVYQQYRDAANQNMEQSEIPPGLRDYVRDYFSQLEP